MNAVEFVASLLIVLLLIISSFTAGLKLSNYYHRKAEAEKDYALRKQYARLCTGSDADDPAAPYVPRNNLVLPSEFEQRLRKNGRATASINPNP